MAQALSAGKVDKFCPSGPGIIGWEGVQRTEMYQRAKAGELLWEKFWCLPLMLCCCDPTCFCSTTSAGLGLTLALPISARPTSIRWLEARGWPVRTAASGWQHRLHRLRLGTGTFTPSTHPKQSKLSFLQPPFALGIRSLLCPSVPSFALGRGACCSAQEARPAASFQSLDLILMGSPSTSHPLALAFSKFSRSSYGAICWQPLLSAHLPALSWA